MAYRMRKRNIDPGLVKNEDLADCSIWARFLFACLPMIADREGRLEDRPRRIEAEVFPYDGQDANALLGELAAAGFITRYEANGGEYIQIEAFSKHQHPHRNEAESTIPPYQGLSKDIPRTYQGHTKDIPRLPDPDPDPDQDPDQELCPSEMDPVVANGKSVSTSEPEKHPTAADLLRAWNEMATVCSCPAVRNMGDKRKTALCARRKDPWWRENWRAALDTIPADKWCQGVNSQGWVASIDYFLRPESVARILERLDKAASSDEAVFDSPGEGHGFTGDTGKGIT